MGPGSRLRPGASSHRPARGRAVIVHDRAHALAALAAAREAGVPVTLLSAPGAAASLGAAVFQAMIADARAGYTDVAAAAVLDCGAHPGLALAALRQGVEAVVFDGPGATAAKIADIAGRSGATLYRRPPPALDLAEADEPLAACRAWLAGKKK